MFSHYISQEDFLEDVFISDALPTVAEQDICNGRKDLWFKSNVWWRQCCGCACDCVFFLITDPTEVYTWGNNTNFSLGHGNQESRQHPELVDVFARTGVYIKQVG